MEPGLTSALAAVMGALVGGLSSLASTWVGERSRNRRDLLQREIGKRETTYSDFIEKAAQLTYDAATHRAADVVGETALELVKLYAVASRIRLFASDRVLLAAEKVIEQLLVRFGDEVLTDEQLRESILQNKEDFLKDFSAACRNELQGLQRKL
ncbi:MAG TPA: hypothetical protein VNS63_21415 [Blastocatellia bacterium]|nr:hypothetical protein [Blastocatellia bacterium]